MYTRITQGMLTANFLRNLMSISKRVSYTQEQLATGKALLKPSDSPLDLTRVLQFNLSLSQITQFKKNVEDGISQVEKTGSTLLDVTNAIQDARDLALDGASDNLNSYDRAAIANVINQLLEATLQSANDSFRGRFIFAGYHTQTTPFIEDRNSRSGYVDNVRYAGNLGSINRRIGRASRLPVNFNGYDVFLHRTHTYEGTVLPVDKPLGFTGTLTINYRDFVIKPEDTIIDITNMINADSKTEVFAEIQVNQLVLRSTNSDEEVVFSDSEGGRLLQDLGLAQRGAYNIGTVAPTLPLIDSTPAIFTGAGVVTSLAYDSTNNRLNIRIGPDADPGGGGQAHNIYIPEGTYASVADLAAAIQNEINKAFGKNVLVVGDVGGVLEIRTVATGDEIDPGDLVIGGVINGLSDNASDWDDLNLIASADPAPATPAGIGGTDGNDKLIIDIGPMLSISGSDVLPQVIDLRAAYTTTTNDLVDEINYQIFNNSYLRGVVKASVYDGRVKIESVATGDEIPASELVITEGATGTLTALNLEITATPAHIDGAVLVGFPVTITAGVNDQITFDLGPTVSSDGINPDPMTVTLTAGNYATISSLVDEINLQIRRNPYLFGSIQAVVGGSAPNEFIRIESVNQGSRIRGEDLNISGTALATLGLAAGDAINGGGTSPGEGVHLEPQNIFETLVALRDDLLGVAGNKSKLVNLFNDSGTSIGLMDSDIITISTSTKTADITLMAFHRVEDLVFALNDFFGTQAHVSLTRDGRLEFENLESVQIADLSITAKSPDGVEREEFNALFKNFPLNVPGGSKVISEKMIDPQRYWLISDAEIGKLDIELESALGFESMVGARSNRMQQTRGLFEDSELNVKNLKSDLEDANFAEVVTKLSQMESVLEAALNTGSRVLTPSLLDYLK